MFNNTKKKLQKYFLKIFLHTFYTNRLSLFQNSHRKKKRNQQASCIGTVFCFIK